MTGRKRFLLISIIPRLFSDQQALKELREVKSLIESYGGNLVELLVQRREIHDKGSFIGEGKIREAGLLIKEKNIDVVVLNGIIKPGQIFEMKSIFIKSRKQIEVWDRVDLILQIFANHANTKEARLQIELAAMKHMGPRIYGMGMVLSRQRGGIGTRGVGETNTELMKRHWHSRMKTVKNKLDKLTIERTRQQFHRKRLGLKTVSLIGYTNAGKTSLFNLITNKNKEIDNALFVTLDSVVGKIDSSKTNNDILVSDTIGFIAGLPIDLIEAFKSTLIESIHSDILLHVIDASDEDVHSKINVVVEIINELGLKDKKVIYVCNKIDIAKDEYIDNLRKSFKSDIVQFISVKSGQGIDELLATIYDELGYENYDVLEDGITMPVSGLSK